MLALLFLIVASVVAVADAFSSSSVAATIVSKSTPTTASSLSMVKFDGDKWVPTEPEESIDAYPAINTLLLHGPKPFFSRVFTPGDYEQAIYKFMAGDKVDRATAQGNMDMYLKNPQDWQFNRFEEQRLGVKYDYVTLKPEVVILVTVWSSLVAALAGRAVYSIVNHVGYVSTRRRSGVPGTLRVTGLRWHLHFLTPTCLYVAV